MFWEGLFLPFFWCENATDTEQLWSHSFCLLRIRDDSDPFGASRSNQYPWGSTVFFFRLKIQKPQHKKFRIVQQVEKNQQPKKTCSKLGFGYRNEFASHWIFITHQDCFSMHFCPSALPWIIGSSRIRQIQSTKRKVSCWARPYSEGISVSVTTWTVSQRLDLCSNKPWEGGWWVKLWGENLWLGDLATLK